MQEAPKKNLYKITFVNQQTGENTVDYVTSPSLKIIEEEYSDIITIEVLTPYYTFDF